MFPRSSSLLTLAAVAAIAAPAAAQCQPSWLPTIPGSTLTQIANGDVFASVLWDPDGTGPKESCLVVAGSFTAAGASDGYNHIAMWDGTAWKQLTIAGINGNVSALAVHDGELIAGGEFSSAGGVACSNIAAFNGTAWHPLGTGTFGPVLALASSGSTLYVGGDFTVAGPVTANNISRWNGTTWTSIVSGTVWGVNGPVRALAVDGTSILVGGSFTSVGNTPANRIARWTGSSWQALGSGVSGDVLAITKYNNEVYAGGSFARANGNSTTAFGLARWNGSAWNTLGPGGSVVGVAGTQTDVRVSSLHVHDGLLYVGGLFQVAGGVPAASIASWNGSAFAPLGAGVGPTSRGVASLLTQHGTLVASGFFLSAGGRDAGSIARWNGSEWSPLQSIVSGPAYALSIVNSTLVAGGNFDMQLQDGETAHNFVAFDFGGLGAPFVTAGGINGTNGPVYAVCPVNPLTPAQPQTQVIAGQFTSAGGAIVNNIAQVNFLNAYSPMGAGFDGPVTCVRQFGSSVYAGGSFSASGATSVNRIARYVTGSWVPLGTGLSGGTPRVMAVYNGNLYVGGDFTSAGGVDTGSLARWDGANWNIVAGRFNGTVSSLIVHNGRLIIGGVFPAIGGCSNVIAWDGQSFSPLASGLGSPATGFVSAIAVHNGDLYAAGAFELPNSTNLVNLAVWNGAFWQEVDSSVHGGSITALQSYGGALWGAGSFTSASGHYQPFVSRFICSCYANCDNSTAAPVLNANDFVCFLNAFAAGSSYANCDKSVAAPVLNANDFVCYLNSFAAGCN